MACIAIPALVTSINGSEAVAEVSGSQRRINIFLIPEVEVGDYVLLRSGYATEVYTEQEALEVLELLKEISETSSGYDNL
ncbi:MAG: HypC/HybG/HupF family hydrogenase formation chaperone [Dehalococcoidia bacterium]